QEERAHVAHVLDRLREPCSHGGASLPGGHVVDPVRAPTAALEPGRPDVPVLLQAPQARVNERTGHGPDGAYRTCRLKDLGESPAVTRAFHEESQDAELVRGQLVSDPGTLFVIRNRAD